jgi:arginyl-tRNA synthetase
MSGDVGVELARRVVAAAASDPLSVELSVEEALVRSSTRDGVDYQCDVAMSLGKKLGRLPREVAADLVTNLDSADLVEDVQIAGPGFINLTLRQEWLERQASALLSDDRLGASLAERPRRIAIDYASPNVAKEMHAGNLRSAIIGDSITRLLRFEGHEVIPHNHLGDWGTPFGMLIEHLLDEGKTEEVGSRVHSGQEFNISDLNGFYQEARKKFDADSEFAERSRNRVVLLQGGDERTLALWGKLVEESARHFDKVFELLGIGLDRRDIYGESFYNPYLGEVVDELEAKGLTELSDGAVCVFPDGFSNREGDRLPLIIRKRDGGYGYAATDLATIRYWVHERGVDDLLYVVGTPQAQHFAMVFEVARKAGWLSQEQHAEHINFGTVLGEDGKTMKTRAGRSVKLVELLTEAIERASAIVAERGELTAEQRQNVARAVGIGAVKYADLSGAREKDYTFDWDRMLAMDGNTAVYLQYANTRILSVLSKAEAEPETGTLISLTEPAERELFVKILRFPAAVRSATEAYAPHKLCAYLYETASAFSSFYENCPILVDGVAADVCKSRLALAKLTSKVLVLGLSLLGIEAPQRL